MNCKEFEKQIVHFIENKMDYITLKNFYEHQNICPECREELTIQFLVSEGIQHLKEGDSFDLKKELTKRLSETERIIKWHQYLGKSGLILEIVAILLLGVIAVMMMYF